ncbi:nucleoside triphosphate pyrophosphohydrolase [Dehalobacter sp. DCM]|uniref:nucleoside triphosphate pyrophosphohydrolase n=1 Tax=Dehalobacter sp. DCM TaxID=2907827 RepID=UPI003081201B|nr:nucleoside triphosphate pyrophosphohydrolase [Dehalobacter sp. DCM]
MKPIIHILGLGLEDLDSLSLAVYKMLKQVNHIWLWSDDHPAAKNIIREEFPCEVLFGEESQRDGEANIDDQLSIAAEKIKTTNDLKEIVLALPGFPIAEGKIISGLKERLHTIYDIDTQLLVAPGSMEKLTAIMAELRSEWGCPWDKEQSHHTLKKYLVEETYEVIDAIDSQNMNNFCEELGDLLLQIVFHSQIASESGLFTIQHVMQSITEKLIRRHPHVFGTVQVESSREVLVHWDAIKKAEKAGSEQMTSSDNDTKRFFDMPQGLPALMLADKTQKKAAKVGFDWDIVDGPLEKIQEELTELKAEIDNGDKNNPRLKEELGDVLFSIVNLSRFLEIDAEEALRLGTSKFQKRFTTILAKMTSDGTEKGKYDLNMMNFYWDQVKSEEKSGV